MSFKKLSTALFGIIMSVSFNANAGLIDDNSVLLDDSGATLIEGWLGQGDLDWNSVWYGERGASATSWHNAVDNIGPNVSIYSAVNSLNETVLIGGFTENNWSGNTYKYDEKAFLFNLSTGEHQKIQATFEWSAIYANFHYFAVFGGGHDMYGGGFNLEHGNMTYSYSYGNSQGRIDINNDTGKGNGSLDVPSGSLTVMSLETFTFSPTKVPEPSTLAIFGLSLIGLASGRLKKKQ